MKDKEAAGWRRPVKDINVQIGKRCREARKAAGYTQEQLAETIGVTTQFISDSERGRCGMSVSTFRSICSTLSVSADYLLFGEPEGTSSTLSVDARINRLTAAQKEIAEKQLNLILQSFSVNSGSN